MEFVALYSVCAIAQKGARRQQDKKNKYKKKGEQPRLFYEHHKIIL